MNMISTGSDGNTYTIAPLARKVLRTFACIVALFTLIVFIIEGSLSVIFGIILTGIGLFNIFMCTRPERRHYTPLVLTILYFFSYLLSISNTLLTKSSMPVVGFGAIGSFGFTNEEFTPVVLATVLGMSGIMFAGFLSEGISKYIDATHCRIPTHNNGLQDYNNGSHRICERIVVCKRCLWIWFVISLALLLLMWHLRIGRTGLIHETKLPFKLAGILVYAKKYVIPFIGILLLSIFLKAEKKKLTILAVKLLIIVGIVGSIAGISRGYFVIIVFPPIFFVFLTSHQNDWKRKLVYRFSTIVLVLVVLIVAAVQGLRNIGYEGDSISVSASYDFFLSDFEFDVMEASSASSQLVIYRSVGIRELLAVSSSGVSDLYAPWAIFVSTDSNYLKGLMLSVFGFYPSVKGTKAFGLAYGVFGMLALSGSFTVIFVGIVLSCLYPILVEELFIRKHAYAIAFFFAAYLSLQAWAGLYVSHLVRSGVMILFCYFLMRRTMSHP